MAFNKKQEEKIIDLDATMQGSLSFKEPVNLRINGKFEGNLDVKGTLNIGQAAIVSADIVGDHVIVGGKVKGRITAKESLTFLSTGIIEGDIFPARFNVSEGAVFEGHCSMLHDFLNPQELARYLEVDLNSILDWVNSGKIPGFKEGENWRFERKSIDSWIASGKIGK